MRVTACGVKPLPPEEDAVLQGVRGYLVALLQISEGRPAIVEMPLLTPPASSHASVVCSPLPLTVAVRDPPTVGADVTSVAVDTAAGSSARRRLLGLKMRGRASVGRW